MERDAVTEPVLPLGVATKMLFTARWDQGQGWTLSVTSLTEYESLAVPQEARQHPAALYEHLALGELLDVLEAESRRRRGF